MITHLDQVLAETPDPFPPGLTPGGPDHPMRQVTRDVAFEPSSWTSEAAAEVTARFDELAPDWHTRTDPARYVSLLDALERGGPIPSGPCLEVGSGTGAATGVLAARFARVVSVDLSLEMLRRAPDGPAPRVRADGSRLPVPAGVAGAVALVNALLFPAEVDRVLSPAGALYWVNTAGPATPIYLSAEDVAAAMGPDWSGVAAVAGRGTWAVLRRA
ncbi:MAG: class I SAM-dependent methyltransferase [Acidimicrobiales bacterium]|nr:class I SAM-dependent methyltransferase [Acidimicrobiales bacterium]